MAISMQNKPGSASTGTQINDKLRGPRLVYSTHFPCCTCSYSLGLEQLPLSFFYFLSPSLTLLHLSFSSFLTPTPLAIFFFFFSE